MYFDSAKYSCSLGHGAGDIVPRSPRPQGCSHDLPVLAPSLHPPPVLPQALAASHPAQEGAPFMHAGTGYPGQLSLRGREAALGRECVGWGTPCPSFPKFLGDDRPGSCILGTQSPLPASGVRVPCLAGGLGLSHPAMGPEEARTTSLKGKDVALWG